MRRRNTELDRRVADALRANAAPNYDERGLGPLATRIERAARPVLDEMRRGGRVGNWWDFAAGWAGTLIPLGVTVAAASVALLWLARPVAQRPLIIADATVTSPTLILGAAGTSAPKVDLIDLAVNEIVRPASGAQSSARKR